MTMGGARLLVYAGGECEPPGAGGGIALVTALVVVGRSPMMCLKSSENTSNTRGVFLMSTCSSATSAPIILSPAELPGRDE